MKQMNFIPRFSSLTICFISPMLFYLTFSEAVVKSQSILAVIGNPYNPSQLYFVMLVMFLFIIRLLLHFEKELKATSYHNVAQTGLSFIISANFIGVIVSAALLFQSL